ncbi:MAG: hypothetical protein GX235_01320 [Clostridiales bacterium]|nr:hypothetical protein [Clostridiales bacterium]
MSGMMVNNSLYAMRYVAATQTTNSREEKIDNSFSAQIKKSGVKKNSTGATEDYKKRHPEQAAHVDSQVQAGKNVLRKNGVENVCRENMTMDEYKKFFTDLMNSIPYDWSQKNDVNVWFITEAGWEQMKNDPDYEAWVLGYTAEDRAVNNPYVSMPGYSPSYHTEHFGASIDEHLGQGFSMSNSSIKKPSNDEESWWEKRHRKIKEIMKQQEEKAQKEAAARKIDAARQSYESAINKFSNSMIGSGYIKV